MSTYESFLARKRVRAVPTGFKVDRLDTEALFPFQDDTVRWALELGRAAVFAETGLGKGPMLLTWSHHVAKHTGGKVLVLAPLAVGPQLVREAYKFGVSRVAFGRTPGDFADDVQVCITNYDNVKHFNGEDYAGIVAEEGSAIKAFMGKRARAVVELAQTIPYRLITTATPSPNDFTELGMHADFLGWSTRSDMLARFYINDLSDTGTWRLKGHAVKDFWSWVATWARSITKPSDVHPEYDDAPYVLPPLHEMTHIIDVDVSEGRKDGMLMRVAETSATKYHEERRLTAKDRAKKAAELVAEKPDEQWLLWASTDYDCDAVREAIDGIVEVKGSDSDQKKEERLLGFADGKVRRMLTKSRIAGLGLNFQSCANMIFVGPDYSFEADFQSVRRCWRFGQTREVYAHRIFAATEAAIWANVSGKRDQHDEMRREMLEASRREAAERRGDKVEYVPNVPMEKPEWMVSRG